MLVALISRKISIKEILRKEMYANDLAMIADKKQELQEVLEEWKGVYKLLMRKNIISIENLLNFSTPLQTWCCVTVMRHLETWCL